MEPHREIQDKLSELWYNEQTIKSRLNKKMLTYRMLLDTMFTEVTKPYFKSETTITTWTESNDESK